VARPTRVDTCGAASVGAAAYALCDTLHELGHLAATLLPVHVSVLSISSVGISTTTSSPVVALAGPLVNLLLGGALPLSRRVDLPSNLRYFLWLFGTVNLFNGVAYLMYSALLGSGDWAAVFNALAPAALWRPAAAIGGASLYAGAVFASLGVVRGFIAEGVVSKAQAERYCLGAYWAGGSLLVAASVLNPISPWLILTSGAATGFGAMVGLVLVALMSRGSHTKLDAPKAKPIQFGRMSVLGGALASLGFVLVLGPGVKLTPDTVSTTAVKASRSLAQRSFSRLQTAAAPDRAAGAGQRLQPLS
jgi:hypothetical protein